MGIVCLENGVVMGKNGFSNGTKRTLTVDFWAQFL